MARRRQNPDDDSRCACEPRKPQYGNADGFGCALEPPACTGGHKRDAWSSTHHHFGCVYWDADDSGNEFRPFKAFLGSPRTPYAKWVKTASPYPWPLWRNRKPPKALKVETAADVTRRLLAYKPAGYTWRIERLTPAQRIALGCLPKPTAQATPKRAREAA